MTIAVFGSANIDIAVRVDQLPVRGQTIHAADHQLNLGGKGANQAVAARALYDGAVRFVAAVGQDPFGDLFCAEIARLGLSTDDLYRDQAKPTGIALIHVDAAADNAITVCGGANMAWPASGPDAAIFEHAAVALFQLETPLEATIAAVKSAKAAGAVTIVDPAPMPSAPVEGLLALADVITPNEAEAVALGVGPVTTTDEAMRAAAALCQRGPRQVVITLGARGVVYCDGSETPYFLPALAVDAVDTTAAGDCFNGALAAGIAAKMAFDDAVKFAIAASALSVTRPGTAASIPTRAAVQKFMRDRQI